MRKSISGFYPVDMDRDGVYQIQTYQKINGLYHADSFGYIINTLEVGRSKVYCLALFTEKFPENGRSVFLRRGA